MHDERLAITEKAALVAWEIMGLGRAYTIADIAGRFDVDRNTARRMLLQIANVLPIERDDLGRWRRSNTTAEQRRST